MDFQSFVVPLLSGLVSGAITAVITYLSTRSRIKLDLTAEYDKELRRDRLEVYKNLWSLLKTLARFSREEHLTYQAVKHTSDQMRDWYFERGGIYLSRKTRDPYFELKRRMQEIIDDSDLSEQTDKPLDDTTVAAILESGNRLRASMADDIGTRRGPFT